jgi:hypothetical protein
MMNRISPRRFVGGSLAAAGAATFYRCARNASLSAFSELKRVIAGLLRGRVHLTSDFAQLRQNVAERDRFS